MTLTYWNGEPVKAVRGTAIVADAPEFERYWAKAEGLVGTRIPMICVEYDDKTFCIDDIYGSGWFKLTVGHGSSSYSHRSLRIVEGSFEPLS